VTRTLLIFILEVSWLENIKGVIMSTNKNSSSNSTNTKYINEYTLHTQLIHDKEENFFYHKISQIEKVNLTTNETVIVDDLKDCFDGNFPDEIYIEFDNKKYTLVDTEKLDAILDGVADLQHRMHELNMMLERANDNVG